MSFVLDILRRAAGDLLAPRVLAVMFMPMLAALFITALVFMPLLVKVVSDKHYPLLERVAGGTFLGSVANGVYALAIYTLIWIITLPFWLLGPFGFAISVILNAWLNQRLFLYDALAEHASAQEMHQLRREGGWPLYLLAALLGLLHFVPVVNFFAPVYMGLAFTHYGLEKLNQYRSEGTP